MGFEYDAVGPYCVGSFWVALPDTGAMSSCGNPSRLYGNSILGQDQLRWRHVPYVVQHFQDSIGLA